MPMIFSSKTTGLFYDAELGSELPADAIELSSELHQYLLSGQAANKRIDFDTEPPSLADRPPPSKEQLADIERNWRATQLIATDGVVARHRDESERGMSVTLEPEQYEELQTYRRDLRDWPQADDFPLAEYRPIAPDWLPAHTR